jgi:hypothetical protein
VVVAVHRDAEVVLREVPAAPAGRDQLADAVVVPAAAVPAVPAQLAVGLDEPEIAVGTGHEAFVPAVADVVVRHPVAVPVGGVVLLAQPELVAVGDTDEHVRRRRALHRLDGVGDVATGGQDRQADDSHDRCE